jgi:hypothetical protein
MGCFDAGNVCPVKSNAIRRRPIMLYKTTIKSVLTKVKEVTSRKGRQLPKLTESATVLHLYPAGMGQFCMKL